MNAAIEGQDVCLLVGLVWEETGRISQRCSLFHLPPIPAAVIKGTEWSLSIFPRKWKQISFQVSVNPPNPASK